MPNATVRANAQATPIDRRAALGSIASAVALFAASGVATATAARSNESLEALIASHRAASEAFDRALDEQEAAVIGADALVTGIGGFRYKLSYGKERIAGWIEDNFNSLAQMAKTLAASSPIVGADALAILKRERDAAQSRLNAVYAPWEAASLRCEDMCVAEGKALLAICAYRCATPADSATKFRYLAPLSADLNTIQIEAVFASLTPEGEA